MEITPKNYLDNGFEILRDALKPFIYEKLHKHYGIAWWEKGVIDKLYHTEQLPRSGSDPELIGHLDLYELIRVFQANYKDVFYNYFKSYSPQNYSTFLVDARNGNSHQNDFNKIDKEKAVQALANSKTFLNAINIDKLSYIQNAIIEIGTISKELLGEPQKRQVVGMGVIQENSETIKQPTPEKKEQETCLVDTSASAIKSTPSTILAALTGSELRATALKILKQTSRYNDLNNHNFTCKNVGKVNTKIGWWLQIKNTKFTELHSGYYILLNCGIEHELHGLHVFFIPFGKIQNPVAVFRSTKSELDIKIAINGPFKDINGPAKFDFTTYRKEVL